MLLYSIRMKGLRNVCICVLLWLCSTAAIAGESPQQTSYSDLLTGYINNSIKLRSLDVKNRQAQIEKQKTGIENGASFSVSSGQISMALDSGTSVTATPSATVRVPAINNTSITAKAPFTLRDSAGSTEMQAGANGTAAGISAKTDIIGSSGDERQIALLKADRAVIESENNAYAGLLSVKKEFAQQIVSLLTDVSDILNKRDDLLEYENDLLHVRIQGYAPASAKYRSAQLKADTARRATEEALRIFNRDYQLFMEKCGRTPLPPATETGDIFALLPENIPDENPVFFDDFPLTSFIEIESGEWNHYLQSLVRKADKPFNLAGTAGWEYSEPDNETAAHAVTAGLETTYKGFSAAAGVSLPVTGNGTPGLTFSFGWDPAAGKIKNLETETGGLDSELELLAIRQAEETLRTAKITCDQTRRDLLWAKKQYEEEYAVSAALQQDSATGYRNGIVSESDYRQAVNDYYQAHITELTGRLNRIIYNIDTAALFSAPAQETSHENEN